MSDYRTYRNMLMTHKHRLDDELEVQADIYERISSATAKAEAAANAAKDELVRTEGRLTLKLKDSEEKLTVAEMTARVVSDPERRAAFAAHQQALMAHGEWSGLREAWKQKGFAIKTLADLYTANYYQPNTAGRETETKVQDERRAAMRRAGGREERAVDAAVSSAREAGIRPRREAEAEPARRERRRAE